MSTARAFWVFLWKPEGAAVRKMAAQRRVRRAQLLMRYSVHCVALWATLVVYRKKAWLKHHWMHFDSSDAGVNSQFMLMDSELIPMMFVMFVSLGAQVRPIRSGCLLDALTILFALVFAFQYHLMSESISGLNIELYLYNASWMLMLHMCINLTIGRAIVTVPCTVVVAIVDVHYFGSLTTLNSASNFVFSHYYFKQALVCLMVCSFQISFDGLRGKEFQAAVAVSHANLHEQLATRLTDSMCDAVVHLDDSLNLAKPAPKLGQILFRDRLGILPANFLKFVVPNEHERFEQYMKYAASADIAETLIPHHFTLLDSSGCSCKVQMFVSAFYDDDGAVHYILGISEIVDFQCKQRNTRANVALDDARHSPVSDIPEDSIFDDSDGEMSTDPSSASLGIGGQDAPMLELSVCQRTGIILHINSEFPSWSEATCRGKHFPSLFHDPSDVWVWLQTSAHRITSVEDGEIHGFQRKVCMIVRRNATIEVELMILDTKAQVDDADALDLQIRVLKNHRRSIKQNGLYHFKHTRAPRVHALRAVGSCIDSSMEAALALAEQKFKPMLRKRWGEWENWWNQCYQLIEQAPFHSSQGGFKMELLERGPNEYVVSLQVLSKFDDRTPQHKRIEASPIGVRMLL
eukprot:TRINITY_DN2070_c0_g2_i2.p1 TRINITY_DN2070_c0_g2~~TRINITY_DN2070_c0_g2_i2.p1  ORF type:complete len:633 (-),score=38.53 TRINITY_DN2070_c0_g2_i2:205-2103(-)